MTVVSTEKQADALQAALIAVDRGVVRKVFTAGVNALGPVQFMENVVVIVMDRIGESWEAGELSLSQVYMAGRICEELSLSVLPDSHADRRSDPSVALGVFEDRHQLGKQLVHSVLRNGGCRVQDLGRVTLNDAIATVRTGTVEVLLLSCLMLSSALRIERLCATIHAENLPVKIIVGGAPFRFDENLWREVGADAMGRTASQALTLIGTVAGVRV